MINQIKDNTISKVKEPQIALKLHNVSKKKEEKGQLNVVSLFSGCGGMDLGFEGGFKVKKESVNEILNKDFIESFCANGYIKLKKHDLERPFQMIF